MKKINKRTGTKPENRPSREHSNAPFKQKDKPHGNSRKRSEHKSELDLDITPQRKRRTYSADQQNSPRSENKPPYEKRERKSYGSSENKPPYEKRERREFGNSENKPPYEKRERRSYGSSENKPPYEKRERRSYGSSENNPPYEKRERREFVNYENKPPYEKRERREFGNSENKPPYEKRERREFGNSENKPPYEKRERREFGNSENKPPYEKRERRSSGGNAQRPPSYDMSRLREIAKRRQEVGKRRGRNDKENKSDGTTRLNRFIANAGVCSRREADDLILAGKIKVNGVIVSEMGYKVRQGDKIEYGGKPLKREKLVYVLLNKPKDHITTVYDPEGRKTVMNLIREACEERIFPVGRLDRNTTGLLLFTNDGELAEKLMHPSNRIKKEYKVILDKTLTPEDELVLMAGVELEDGKSQFDKLYRTIEDNTVVVELHSGKNRIVRRMFEHLNYEVIGLDRVGYAGLDKKNVQRGEWRYLTEKEVINLKFF